MGDQNLEYYPLFRLILGHEEILHDIYLRILAVYNDNGNWRLINATDGRFQYYLHLLAIGPHFEVDDIIVFTPYEPFTIIEHQEMDAVIMIFVYYIIPIPNI